ncbi:MAG: hypothetical protein AMK69_23255 [Nitrospira bacterium SG8_3]|nr:MAG: hypothetical protein AMK69_23255 [Nitrospira bacterium SG8_3]
MDNRLEVQGQRPGIWKKYIYRIKRATQIGDIGKAHSAHIFPALRGQGLVFLQRRFFITGLIPCKGKNLAAHGHGPNKSLVCVLLQPFSTNHVFREGPIRLPLFLNKNRF